MKEIEIEDIKKVAEIRIFLDEHDYIWVSSTDNMTIEETKNLIEQALEAIDDEEHLEKSKNHLRLVKTDDKRTS